jgi:CheY-like chemotaxis protein
LRSRSLLARIGTSEARAATPIAPAIGLPNLTGIEILVAEDNDINALIVSRHLEKCGARVVRAENGAAALAEAKGRRFDAIILDIRMPGLDGLEVARRIRAAEAESGTARRRLIAVSADAFDAAAQAALAAGVDAFLTKPVDLARLARALKT